MANEPPRKKTSAWKVLGIVVGVILLSILALIVWATSAGSRKIARLKERSRARLAEVRAADGRRPVLRDDPQEGNAWVDYALAQTEAMKFPNPYKLSEIVQRQPKADPEAGKAALAAHGVAIDHLRRGAGRAVSRPPYEWEQSIHMTLPNIKGAALLANLAVLRARALVVDGKSREAAGVLLDVCQYGRDTASDGVVLSYTMGMGFLGLAFNEIREHLVAGSFDQAALEDLARGLEVLDGNFPRYGPVMLNEALLFAGGPLEESGGGPIGLLQADALEKWGDIAAEMAAAESLPWAELQAQGRRREVEIEQSWNPALKALLPPRGPVRVSRVRKAQLRLLRAAVQGARSQPVPDLDDPFGGKLKTEAKAGSLKLWSIGPDGVDDGGSGEFKSDQKDILLEIKR